MRDVLVVQVRHALQNLRGRRQGVAIGVRAVHARARIIMRTHTHAAKRAGLKMVRASRSEYEPRSSSASSSSPATRHEAGVNGGISVTGAHACRRCKQRFAAASKRASVWRAPPQRSSVTMYTLSRAPPAAEKKGERNERMRMMSERVES